MTRMTSVVAVAILAAGGSLALVAERRLAAPAAVPAAAASVSAAPRAAGVFRDVTIPEGTALPLVLDTGVSTATSRLDDPVRAHLARAIVINGLPAIPQGSEVVGTVTATERSEKVKGRAHIAIRFDNVRPAGVPEEYGIRTAAITRTAAGTMKKDLLTVALPAAGGALLGGALGGGKGALIGTAVGGGAGAAYTLDKKGPDVGIAAGRPLSARLLSAITVRVPVP
ncbi:MAG: hypothetical protein LAO77_04660 [Acidobacteriia bacterium]|nr:hypothetical protein [Terriglobia bacterium]